MSPPRWLVALRHERRRRRLAARTHRDLLPPPPSAFAALGAGTSLVPPIRIWGAQYMRIGRDVMLMETGFISAVPGPDGTAPELVIGDRTSISDGFTIAVTHRVHIGADCMFAARVFIGDASHEFADPELPIRDQGMTDPRAVHIGDGTFLGIGTLVLPGSRIGRGVMVGAGSVVSGELPDHTVAVGNPARVIRRYDPQHGWVRADDPAT